MSKYKFSLSGQIRGYIEWQLEHFKEDKRQLEQYKNEIMQQGAINYSAAPSHSGISNPTEKAGILLTSSPYILTTERNIQAIEKVLERCDKADLTLIDLIYWRRTHTVEGAGMKVNYSRRTAYRKINSIICMVALEMGLVSK